MIKEVIVVEGRDDITAVKQAVDAELIAVGGFGINAKVIERIKEAQKRKGVIVLTDPDFAGEKIRSIISKRVKGIKHAYIAQEDGIKGDDIGVENASPEVIREALERAKVSEEDKEPIFDFEVFDPGAFPFLLFQLCQPGFTLCFGSAQLVDRLVEALFDHAALTDGNRRLFDNCLFDQRAQILQCVDIVFDFYQLLGMKILQHAFDRRQHLHGITECDQIPRVRCFVADFTQQAFQIVNRV